MEGIVEISNYIYDKLDDSYESKMFLEKLILLDNEILLELFDLLVEEKIILEDVMILQDITDDSIRKLIDKFMGSSSNVTPYDWNIAFDRNLNFNNKLADYIGNHELFVRRNSVGISNYRVNLKYDIFDPERYLKDYIVFSKEYPEKVKLTRNYISKYKTLTNLVSNLPWNANQILQSLDDMIETQLFVNTPYNIISKKKVNEHDVVRVLNDSYLQNSLKIVTEEHNKNILELISNDIDFYKTGYDYLEDKINIEWSQMEFAGTGSIFNEFEILKVYKIFYKSLYSRYITLDSINRDKNIVDYFINQVIKLYKELVLEIIKNTKNLAYEFGLYTYD